MGGAGDDEKFLVRRTGSLSEGFLGHVTTIGNLTGDDEQRLVDEVGVVRRVPGHHVHQ